MSWIDAGTTVRLPDPVKRLECVSASSCAAVYVPPATVFPPTFSAPTSREPLSANVPAVLANASVPFSMGEVRLNAPPV